MKLAWVCEFAAATVLAGCLGAAPTAFDYYVLSLSWAPAFCSQPGEASRSPAECAAGRGIGFVVHGLWQEVVAGRARETCATRQTAPNAVINMMLPEMYSPELIRREWTTHGSCTGLSPFDYFSNVEQARAAVQIPVQFGSADESMTESPGAIEQQFAAANPGLPRAAFRVACRAGVMTEVRVCFSRDLKGRACSQSAGECRAARIEIPSIR